MSDAPPSTAAQRSLLRARLRARVTAVMVLVPCLPMAVGIPWMLVDMVFKGDVTFSPKMLTFPVMLGTACFLAILALVHGSRLGRLARGERAAAVGAFRLLRLMWIVATVAYAILLVDELTQL